MTQTPEQHAAAVLARCSILDVVESLPADILALSEKTANLEIIRSGQIGYFNFATVASGDRVHEVRLFESWSYCSCEAFFYRVICQYSVSICRHAVYAMSQVDSKSYHRIIDQQSVVQSRERIVGAVLSAPRVNTERIGNIPI